MPVLDLSAVSSHAFGNAPFLFRVPSFLPSSNTPPSRFNTPYPTPCRRVASRFAATIGSCFACAFRNPTRFAFCRCGRTLASMDFGTEKSNSPRPPAFSSRHLTNRKTRRNPRNNTHRVAPHDPPPARVGRGVRVVSAMCGRGNEKEGRGREHL